MRDDRPERHCLAVYRELAHSPGRETDDAEILRATGAHLERAGFAVSYVTPDELPEDPTGAPPSLFVMCERLGALETLRRYEEVGATGVNGVGGIRNTYRDLTIQRFEKDGVPFPRSVLVESAAPLDGEGLDLANGTPCWVKRGDVHATEAGPV